MVSWVKSLLGWREIFRAGVYVYQENIITGERRCYRYISGGYSPKNLDWLRGIESGKTAPPTGGSALG